MRPSILPARTVSIYHYCVPVYSAKKSLDFTIIVIYKICVYNAVMVWHILRLLSHDYICFLWNIIEVDSQWETSIGIKYAVLWIWVAQCYSERNCDIDYLKNIYVDCVWCIHMYILVQIEKHIYFYVLRYYDEMYKIVFFNDKQQTIQDFIIINILLLRSSKLIFFSIYHL